MNNKWITFDLDETLMKNPFGEWVFPEIKQLYQQYSNSDIDILPEVISVHKNLMKDRKFLEAYDWDKIVNQIFQANHLNIKVNIEKLVIKHTVKNKVKLLERDLLTNLQSIKDAGFKLAAVTNGYYKYQFPVLVELGLFNLLDTVITADKSKAAKPDINVFSPLQNNIIVAHVGDRIDHDIVAANLFNIHAVFINRNLPQSILSMPINERIEEETMKDFCQKKWIEENNEIKLFDPSLCYPDFIVSSIQELAENIHLFK